MTQADDLSREHTRLRETLAQLERTVAELRAENETTEARATRVGRENRRLASEMESLRGDLDRQRQDTDRAIGAQKAELERTRRSFDQQLHEMQSRHAAELAELQRAVEDLARRRHERDASMRSYAEALLKESERDLDHLGTFVERLEEVDLAGRWRAARGRASRARTTVLDSSSLPDEAMAAASALGSSVRALQRQFHDRCVHLDGLADAYLRSAESLVAAARGAPVACFADQTAIVAQCMGVEADCISRLVEANVRGPVRALRRWNGYTAAAGRIDAWVSILTGEVAELRSSVAAASSHAERRCELSEQAIQAMAFHWGGINPDPPGALADPENPKSTYVCHPQTNYGEIRVVIPWIGAIEATGPGGNPVRLPPQEPNPSTDVRRAGMLLARLRKRLEATRFREDRYELES